MQKRIQLCEIELTSYLRRGEREGRRKHAPGELIRSFSSSPRCTRRNTGAGDEGEVEGRAHARHVSSTILRLVLTRSTKASHASPSLSARMENQYAPVHAYRPVRYTVFEARSQAQTH